MSHQLTPDEVLFRQRFLSCSGVYKGKLDGVWGAVTDAAEAAFFNECDRIAEGQQFDPRSEKNIRSLRLDAQHLCRQSLAAIRGDDMDARVISGTRTYAQQSALYRQGRSLPGQRVTNAKAGQSWHNFGLAWDIGIFRNGEYLTSGSAYDRAGRLGTTVAGVEWGGNWKTFVDKPHFQTPFGASRIAEARGIFEAGKRAG